jgi:hypothetical protein
VLLLIEILARPRSYQDLCHEASNSWDAAIVRYPVCSDVEPFPGS